MNSGILRITENIPITLNGNKPVASEQKLPRLRAKALGDVQNTLHSRPANLNSNANSTVKVPSKSSIHLKPSHENYLTSKNASGRKTSFTPCNSAMKTFLATPNINDEMFESHHHKLCEQDQDAHLFDYFSEYRLTEEHMNNLVRTIKTYGDQFPVSLHEPCEEIDTPEVGYFEEGRFSISDILSDIFIPEVPPFQ